jgi:site-specific recombinase
MPDLQAQRKLQDLLARQSDPHWLEDLFHWLREASPQGGDASPRSRRLRGLNESIASSPDAESLRHKLRDAWNHASAIRLLAETGLPDRTTFFGEGFRRIVDLIIPRLDAVDDLYALLDRLRLDEADADWIATLPMDLLETWSKILMPARKHWLQAAQLLAQRAAAVGLSRDLLELDPEASDADSPFFQLSRSVREFSEAPSSFDAQIKWQRCLAACRAELGRALDHLDVRGVSTDMVFRLELLDAKLKRIDTLLRFAADDPAAKGRDFAIELVRGSSQQRSFRAFVSSTLKRLARKVVEHTGETGEHYVANSHAAWRATGLAAAGGGVLTAFTALLKYGLGALPLAPMILGFSLTGNYAGSFIAMQMLGFTLASKQPAMTAAALAGALEMENGEEHEIELVAGITRSQVIATLGNVLCTIPTALIINFAWLKLFKHPVLSLETAKHGLEAIHPFRSLTLPFAALTGVFLWMSSLAAGWASNWSAYRRLPEALEAQPRLRRWLGETRLKRLGRFLRQHLSGIVGFLSLGLLLGFMPILFKFAGLPIEVRHVTLQAASWALNVAGLWKSDQFQWNEVIWGLSSIALIGALNFSVSFALALRTAFRARDLSAASRRHLWFELLKRLNRDPKRFLWAPPKEKRSNLEATLSERDHV